MKLENSHLDAARAYNVRPDIHRDDYIFRHHVALCKKDLSRAYGNYLFSGRTNAEKIRDLTARHLDLPIVDEQLGAALSILDFASGYGCSTRHFANLFPNATVAPMDIHAAAFDFNTQVLGLPAVLSKSDPAALDLTPRYDVVFALSFFSHLPHGTQARWLAKLSQFVAPGGLLIFTTHGETTHRQHMPYVSVGEDGYGFIADSEQFDLSPRDYGIAITYRSYVERDIGTLSDMIQLDFLAAFWWGHQDTYVLRKMPNGAR